MHTQFRLTEIEIHGDTVYLIAPDRLKIEVSVPYPGIFRLIFLRLTPWSEAPRPVTHTILERKAAHDREQENGLHAFDFALTQGTDIKRATNDASFHTETEDEDGAFSTGAPRIVKLIESIWYDDERVVIKSARSRLEIGRTPFSLALFDETERKVLETAPEHAFYMERTASGMSFAAPIGTAFYGLGHGDIEEMAPTLDWRGKKVPVWHDHLPGPSRVILPLVYTSHGAAVLIDNPHPAHLDLAATRDDRWSYETLDGTIDLYVWGAPTIKALLPKYYTLFGRQPLPPLWSLGYMQSKFGYRNETELLRIAHKLREKEIPSDVLILDLYWFRQMGDLTFDRRAFPEPKRMIEQLRSLGFHLIVIEEPYVTVKSRNFPFADKMGLLGKKGDGRTYTFPFWPGEAGLVDFTSPLAQRWWADLHLPLMDLGIAGWWTDLVEPEVHPTDMIHHAGPAPHVHNTLSLGMHEAIYTAHMDTRPEMRLFIMSRSAWFGAGRYGVGVWSGDVHTSWDHLKKQPALMLSMSLAGFPLWNSDIGGFIGDEPSPELYLRWLQFGIFTPQVRPHGAGSPREPWAFGEEVEALARATIRLRYRLLPYIYTMAYQLFAEGLPYVRPLTLETDDPAFLREGNMYMFGDHLLVAPVTEEGQKTLRLRLPSGVWFDLFARTCYGSSHGSDGNDIKGWVHENMRCKDGKNDYVLASSDEQPANEANLWIERPVEHSVERPVERYEIPLFVKAGALIPTVRPADHTGRLNGTEVHLIAVPGNGRGYLYEDDGESLAYQHGDYRLIRFEQSVSGETVTLTIETVHPTRSVSRDRRAPDDGVFQTLNHLSNTGRPASDALSSGLSGMEKSTFVEEHAASDQNEMPKMSKHWILHWFGARPQKVLVNGQVLGDEHILSNETVQGQTLSDQVQRIESLFDGFYTIDLGKLALDEVHTIVLRR